MQRLVPIIVVLALLCSVQTANVNREMKLLQIDNNIANNDVPLKPTSRRFVSITRAPQQFNPLPPGGVVELRCEAVGAPAPSVHWYKNDEPIYNYGMDSNEIIDTNPSSLARVTSSLLVTRVTDKDEYTCIVTAGPKSVRATATVFSVGDGKTELVDRAKLIPLEPRIVVSYKVFVDVIGSNVVLPCRVKGHPRPQITWTDNRGVVIKKDNPRMKVLRSGELVIASLIWSDMGEFTCHATNVFGSRLASTFVYPAKAG